MSTPSEKAKEALKALAPSDDYESVRVEEIRDHADERALRVTLRVRREREALLRDGGNLNRLVHQIHQRLAGEDIELYPYVSFELAGEEAAE